MKLSAVRLVSCDYARSRGKEPLVLHNRGVPIYVIDKLCLTAALRDVNFAFRLTHTKKTNNRRIGTFVT